MKNRDEMGGKAEQVKGKMKQAWGDATGNERLHDEGVAQETGGHVEEGAGTARRKVGDAVEDIGERIKK